jgi:hypothetical protein
VVARVVATAPHVAALVTVSEAASSIQGAVLRRRIASGTRADKSRDERLPASGVAEQVKVELYFAFPRFPCKGDAVAAAT